MSDRGFHFTARELLLRFLVLAAGAFRNGQLAGCNFSAVSENLFGNQARVLGANVHCYPAPGVGGRRPYFDCLPDLASPWNENGDGVLSSRERAETKMAVLVADDGDGYR